MGISKSNLLNIAKIGGSLGAFALGDFVGSAYCAKEIIQAISGNLASNFVAKYDPVELLGFLDKSNSELNHHIEKLMQDSVPKAVELVTVKYLQENPYKDKFVKKTLERLIADAKIKPNKPADEQKMLYDKAAWLDEIHEYIFRGQPDEDGKLTEIEQFFKENLAECYELVFIEGLKDDKDEKPLKAFLIKTLKGIEAQNADQTKLLENITQEIKGIEAGKAPTLEIGKNYFRKAFEKLNQKLDKLLEISKKTEGNIELILQILASFKSDFDEIKRGVSEIKKKIKLSIPHHLTKNPLIPEIFVGRTEELENIRKALFEGENLLLLVNGEGGVGKTTLATRYYLKYQSHYKHLAWVLCEQSIAEALLLLADALQLTFHDTDTQVQRLNKLLDTMVNLDAPCLLVIDNANEVTDLEQNYEYLRQCSNFHVLLTSRITEFRKAKFYAIEGLPLDKAIELFRRHYEKLQANEHQLLTDIYTAVGGNTLVLELIAKTLKQQNALETRYRLADLLADLQQKGILGIQEADAVGVDYHKYKEAKPSEIIRTMYDLAKLQAPESQLLSIFAVLPAESIAYPTLKTLLPNTANLDKTLLTLAQKGWLNHNTTDSSFKCSPVVQEIVRAKNEKLYSDCEELVSTLIDKLAFELNVGTLINITYEEGIVLARYAESVIVNLDVFEFNLVLICEGAINFYKTHGNIEKAIIYAQKDNFLTKKLVENNPEIVDYKKDLAISFQYLGDLNLLIGNLEKAFSYFEKDNQISNELYQDFPNNVEYKYGLAQSYQYLGFLNQSFGNLEEALLNYKKYNQFAKELYYEEPNQVFKNSLAISYEKIGQIYYKLGNLNEALKYFEFNSQISIELHQDYPNHVEFKNGLAVSYQYLGKLHQSMGNLEEAMSYFEEFNQIVKELFHDFPNQVEFKNGLAISCQYLGKIHQSLDNLEKSLSYFQRYNQLEKELHQDYPNQVEFKGLLAISYQYLGILHQSLGDLAKALTFFEEYNFLEKELCQDFPNHVQHKSCLAGSFAYLGKLYKQMGQINKTKEYYLLGEKLYDELVNDFPMYAEFKNNHNWVKNELASL